MGIEILKALMKDLYLGRRQMKILSLTKLNANNDFASITLMIEDAHEDLFTVGFIFHHQKYKVSIIKDKDTSNPSDLQISTTLVTNDLPQRESKITITKTLKCNFGENNIFRVCFEHVTNLSNKRYAHYLMTVIYIEWHHKSTNIVGRRVDFIPHKGSMDNAVLTKSPLPMPKPPPK